MNASSDKTRIAVVPGLRVTGENRRLDEGAGAATVANKQGATAAATNVTRIDERQHERTFTHEGDDATRIAIPQITPDRTRIRQPDGKDRPLGNQGSPSIEATALGHEVLKGRFVLEEVLGAGGMGVVYKAKDLLKVEAKDRDPYVAIKVLSDEFKSHPEAFIALQRESRKSQRIAHPNIVNVHDFDRDGDTVFMTMEYMEGTPLDKLINQYKATGLPTDDAWAIIEGMALALSHAHGENIVHSDFKPGNVFITNKGAAKVFDFGISRAVAVAEHARENPEDKTLFDAGTLGALTPAYASPEMLQGKEPDVRDDIFALGCVAYETLTGVHPYGRVPADEAAQQGLKPRRIAGIKKHQWNAIAKALALRREDRCASVEEFLRALSPAKHQRLRNGIIIVLAMGLIASIYVMFFRTQPLDPMKEFNLRNELEWKVRVDFYKDHLTTLLQSPTFDESWQAAVWKDISDLSKLTRNQDPWVAEHRVRVYRMYLEEIDAAITGWKLKHAKELLEGARRYTDDPSEIERRFAALTKAFAEFEARKARKAEVKEEKPAARVSVAGSKAEVTESRKAADRFKMALANANSQLKCETRLNMPELESAIKKLRQLDQARYKELEPSIVAALADCITGIGKESPKRAIEAKNHALRIFSGNAFLADIQIKPQEVCDLSLAGLGARGHRAICKDPLPGDITGPDLVVVPGKGNMPPFAIGKYEVTFHELNLFCQETRQCAPFEQREQALPAVGISLELAQKYLKWLSAGAGQRYRLPTRSEWVHAASTNRKVLDPNRNCKLSTRGIEKGDGPVRFDLGALNAWGLVNHVGNVQEWVYDKGRRLVAVGGSFSDRMDTCDVGTVRAHDGSPDIRTGFRVLREIRTTHE